MSTSPNPGIYSGRPRPERSKPSHPDPRRDGCHQKFISANYKCLEVAAIADELERLHRQEGHTHARTEADYLLHVKRDPTAALPVAAANFRDQREPIDRSLLIEAANAIDMPEAGEPVQEWLASNGFLPEP